MRRMSILAAVLAIWAASGSMNPMSAWRTSAQEDIPAVVRYMKQVNSSLRHLRREVSGSGNSERALQLVSVIGKNLRLAREEQPLKTPELPEAERDSFLKAYREMIDQVLADLDRLESAITVGNAEEAQKLVRLLYEWKKKGHDQFQKEPDSSEPEPPGPL